MFLGLPNPDPDLKVLGTDPDPSIIQQKSKKNLDFLLFSEFFMAFYLGKIM
jgi:hypothetical protein